MPISWDSSYVSEVLFAGMPHSRLDGMRGFACTGARMMTKTHFNIQDQFLNQVRKARIEVIVDLQSGQSIKGYIRSFDSFCIIVENDKAITLVYKHALSVIRPAEEGVKIPGLI